jgi:hypothetical protein
MMVVGLHSTPSMASIHPIGQLSRARVSGARVSGAGVQARDLDGLPANGETAVRGFVSLLPQKTTEDGGILQSTQFLARVLTKQVSIGGGGSGPRDRGASFLEGNATSRPVAHFFGHLQMGSLSGGRIFRLLKLRCSHGISYARTEGSILIRYVSPPKTVGLSGWDQTLLRQRSTSVFLLVA